MILSPSCNAWKHSQLIHRIVSLFQHFSGKTRPICFVFSGMGSQWFGMGKDLLQLKPFSQVIETCDQVLKAKGVDIYDILGNQSTAVFDNVLNCVVGIAVIQVRGVLSNIFF